MKRFAINPAGLRMCCFETALRYEDAPAEGTMRWCVDCSRRLIVQEGAWRASPAGVTSSARH